MKQIWIQILWHKHPSDSTKGHQAIEEELFNAAIEHGVLAAKGSWFLADQDAEMTDKDKMFFRMNFAASSSDAIVEGVKRYGEALSMVFEIEINGREALSDHKTINDHNTIDGNETANDNKTMNGNQTVNLNETINESGAVNGPGMVNAIGV